MHISYNICLFVYVASSQLEIQLTPFIWQCLFHMQSWQSSHLAVVRVPSVCNLQIFAFSIRIHSRVGNKTFFWVDCDTMIIARAAKARFVATVSGRFGMCDMRLFVGHAMPFNELDIDQNDT